MTLLVWKTRAAFGHETREALEVSVGSQSFE